jgi:nucleotide-binding universal stress UspA family protein
MSPHHVYETEIGPVGGPVTALAPTIPQGSVLPAAAHIDLVTVRGGPVLVPLDGSRLAERALAWAAPVAHQRNVPLVLVTIVEPWLPMEDPPLTALTVPVPYAQRDLEAEGVAAEQALRAHATRLRQHFDGLTVRTDVLFGQPARTLLDLEVDLRPQLVVMASHGRTGLARWVRGSVAERMLHDGNAPVLVIRPGDDPAHLSADAPIKNVLVPLDGSALAAEAVPEAYRLAVAPNGTVRGAITLLGVIEPTPVAREATASFGQAATRDTMGRYLRLVAAQLHEHGVPCTCVTLFARDVSSAIVDDAVLEDADVIVMGTHGRGMLGRLFHGSIADHVAYAARVPVLLCRSAGGEIPPGVRTH